MTKFVRRDGVDYNAHKVYGEYVDIIAGVTFGDSDVKNLVDSMRFFFDRNSTLIVQAISDTMNPLDAAVNSSTSLFSIVGYANLALSIASFLYVISTLRRLYLQTYTCRLNYCSTALLLTLVANALRVLRSLDFAGWRGTFNYTLARMFVTVPSNLGVAGFLLISCFWIDTTNQITSALNMKFVSPPRPWVWNVLVTLSLLLVAIDISAFLLFENSGKVSSVTSYVALTYSGLFLILSGLIFVVILLLLAMHHTVYVSPYPSIRVKCV